MPITTENKTPLVAGSSPVPGSALRVPRSRPDTWKPGDLAIRYITLRPDDHPMPPCVLAMVTRYEGDKCVCHSLDAYDPHTIPGHQIMGVEEAVEYFDRVAEEMTVRAAREGREKLLKLADPITPFPEWVRTMEWWEEHPEDQPDDYALMRSIVMPNAEV